MALPIDIANKLTPTQVTSMQEYKQSIKFGFTSQASPMVCRDEQCPFHDKCPLVINKIPRPFGKDCPIEKGQIASWSNTFVDAAGIDPTDAGSAYDLMIVDQIVFMMLLEARSAWHLAIDPNIERKYISGYNPLGQPFFNYDISKAAEFYERLVKTKLRLLRELLATRKSKADAEAKGYALPSQMAANLIEKANRMRAITTKLDGSTEAIEIEIVPDA